MKLLGGNIRGVDDNRDSNWNNTCTNPTQIITDCYTYIKMPGTSDAIWSHLMSLQPLGNNGETPNENVRNYHTGIQINNSYYYEGNIPAGSIRNFTAQNAGDGGGTITHINYDAASTGINWKQMADQEPVPNWGWTEGQTVSEDQKLSNIIGFDKVTTTENGNSVKGKYTFPGNRKDLEGENYPFPTILQQNTSSGVVNVHYGEWPLNGIYWEESRANMDIFEDLVTDGGENDGQALKTFVLKDAAGNVGNDKQTADFTFSYSYGEDEIAQITSGTDSSTSTEGGTDSAETPDSTDSDGSTLLDDEDLIAKVEKIKYDSEVNGYVATVHALKTGTEIITATVTGASNQTYSASFTLTVTADLTVYASSSTVTQYAGENTELEVFAVPMSMYGVSADTLVTAEEQSIDGNDAVVEESDETNEAVTELEEESENATEIVTEDTENVTEAVTEDTENVTEAMTEDTENVTEAMTEDTEKATETDAENVIEAVSEEQEVSEATVESSEELSEDTVSEQTGEQQDDMAEEDVLTEEGISTQDAVSEIAVQMLSDEEETEELISVYDEDTAAAPEKNLADRMTWKVEIDAEDEGLVDYTEVKDCKFTITSQAESDVTLTITGTYTYEGTDYTAVTWVEVITEADDTSAVDEESGSEGRSIVTEIPGSEDTVIMEDDGSGDVIIQEESEDLNDTVNSDNTENAAGTGEEILDENGHTEEVVTDDNSSDIVIEDNNEATVQENTEDSSVQDQEATEDSGADTVVAENADQDLEAEVGLESLTTDTEIEE